MVLKIRKAAKGDAPALSRIWLLTANAGSSAEALHDFSELPGLVYCLCCPIRHTTNDMGFCVRG